jgi:TATA-box binding protein (TBP) (component of TFIID and TFIIIB)
MHIGDPKTTTLIFATGKMVITGAKSEELAQLAGRKHARMIQKVGLNTKFKDFKVHNFVASRPAGFCVRLEGFVRECELCDVRAGDFSGAGVQDCELADYLVGVYEWKGGDYGGEGAG